VPVPALAPPVALPALARPAAAEGPGASLAVPQAPATAATRSGTKSRRAHLPAEHDVPWLYALSMPVIEVKGFAHVGIRVHDLERSLAFYELLGFTKTIGPIGPEPVAILDHPSGVELNLVLNAPSAKTPNILMDVPEKHPGITHIALLCPDVQLAQSALEAAGIPLSGGPIRLGPHGLAIFVRDPDGNVLELHQRV